MKWAYGVTTVSTRLGDLLPRTLGSLLRGGFPQPHLFIDGANSLEGYKQFGLPMTCHYPNVRTYGNWSLAMHELYYRNTDADRYVLFQDDLVVVQNLRQYLEKSDMPTDGYLNLYTVPENERLAQTNLRWFHSNQQGKGALALVFTRQLLLELLNSRVWLEKPMDPNRGHKNIDGCIVHIMSTRYYGKYKEYCHNPSLVQHVGEQSSMGNTWKHTPERFPGEEFDALSLIGPQAPYTGPIPEFGSSWASDSEVHRALEALEIPRIKVAEWVNRPCVQCMEKNRRINQLGWLAKKALDGNIDEVRARFTEILDT